ncbi:hypothetical protein [Clostridium sp.]|uniref:hypothetical protein n=1 Tax=Clostridium sp. TaxID=1506 RepID=UPI003F36DAB8
MKNLNGQGKTVILVAHDENIKRKEIRFLTMKIRNNKIFILIVSIFVFVNIMWFFSTRIKYHQFTKNIPKNEYGYTILNKDGYTYGVKKPNYMELTGNLYISKNNSSESIIIWPLFTGGFEYGLILGDKKNNMSYEIYVDDNMNPLEKDNPQYLKLINDNAVEVNELYKRARNMWALYNR